MRLIEKTDTFLSWIDGLRDQRARARIAMRLDRLIDGNLGDIKLVGDGVSELRIDYGPGYRVYFIERNDVLIILLCGGDKSTQDRDIRKAKTMAAALRKVRS
ncbi:type II toxin-antitoxin system RelE/ParE family toxin [Phyllobacterium meliloti]|uniref:type II toxin-antitoxin system RelE/ParE family toxin n=1 Tax=Phyllobacterium meliloti TaxID=555317 RepID=UPI001D14780D|nr:type II toxin-antitoxin system RelE/ParE family toxin [Phyllobacterium sp. T1293]UGX87810.1 type II toxin-antitoxin system RelE/ParE family toxin [Phyllobacterium sp. T1293]